MRRNTMPVHRLILDDRGAAAPVIAVTLILLVGSLGLAIDVGFWYNTERRLQLAADAAAVAAAFQISEGKTANQAAPYALKEAQFHGFSGVVCEVNPVTPTQDCVIYNPPQSAFAARTDAVEVVLKEPTQPYFTGMFMASGPTVVGSGIMSASSGSGSYCLLALDGSAANALLLENNAQVQCGAAANSTSTTALNMENNAQITGNAFAVGTLKLKNNAVVTGNAYAGSFNLANNATVGGSKSASSGAMADPYAAFTPDSLDLTQGCADSAGSPMQCKNNCTKTIPPGRYCYGWDFQNNATVNLNPGVYVVESKLVLKNNAIIRSTAGTTGVTIIIKGNYAMDVGNNAQWDFAAPTSGTYAGIAFHSLSTNATSYTQTFQNNATVKLVGALYAPSQKVYFENNAVISQTTCTQVVARLIDIRNNGNFGSACTGTGTKSIGSGTAIETLK